MVEELYKNIFKIGIKLPKNPLKELNSYLIKGEDRSLLIDTGFNREECRQDLLNGLRELDIDLEKLDVFITHLHADHSGNVSLFKDTSKFIYASEIDGKLINHMVTEEYWQDIEGQMYMAGLKDDGVRYEDHPAYKFRLSEPVKFTYLKEGDVLKLGDYNFQVIESPGHTIGQIGLYEKEHKLYFSGDHVLDIITPNIAFWSFESDDLATYIKSLERIIPLDIEYIFSAHRTIMKDHPRRVKEIIDHHYERLEEVYKILTEDYMSTRDVAAKMTWRIRANSWEEFPPAQKWFASGEAMAHLEYFYNRDRVYRKEEDGVLYYALKK